ncbi:MAG: hypothetical protein EZS28_013949 [Streblomastix strix]|uniref:Uncharacterized protein n=1 Tax=Streblomastix strix TaxID=222440 RepID=A0A5J4W6P5_9EUKA|nr:MAG: hypothetical protein EZS28_013949 [Streblomastix strix]
MQLKQEIEDLAKTIISFADSYENSKEKKKIEKSDSESTPFLIEVTSSLQILQNQLKNNNAYKSVTQTPNLLQSLSILSNYKFGTHKSEQVDQQRLALRSSSRWCLYWIHFYGNEQDQSNLVNQGYGRVMSIIISTAGGAGEEQDKNIWCELRFIYLFLGALHEGRKCSPSFQPLPLLEQSMKEQMEEEGANEEVDAQMISSGFDLMRQVQFAKETILNHFVMNHFIHKRRR